MCVCGRISTKETSAVSTPNVNLITMIGSASVKTSLTAAAPGQRSRGAGPAADRSEPHVRGLRCTGPQPSAAHSAAAASRRRQSGRRVISGAFSAPTGQHCPQTDAEKARHSRVVRYRQTIPIGADRRTKNDDPKSKGRRPLCGALAVRMKFNREPHERMTVSGRNFVTVGGDLNTENYSCAGCFDRNRSRLSEEAL